MKKILLALVIFFSFQNTFASHLLGGDVTYQCIGPNQYRVFLKAI
jgi:hypothetical protein